MPDVTVPGADGVVVPVPFDLPDLTRLATQLGRALGFLGGAASFPGASPAEGTGLGGAQSAAPARETAFAGPGSDTIRATGGTAMADRFLFVSGVGGTTTLAAAAAADRSNAGGFGRILAADLLRAEADAVTLPATGAGGVADLIRGMPDSTTVILSDQTHVTLTGIAHLGAPLFG